MGERHARDRERDQAMWIYREAMAAGLTQKQKVELTILLIQAGISYETSPASEHFSPQQVRLIELFIEKMSLPDKEIAQALKLSPKTVRGMVRSIRQRILTLDSQANVNSRIELYLWLKDNFVRS